MVMLSVNMLYGWLPGLPRRLKNLENENGHGKGMGHEKFAKSHGILPILPPNFTKFVFLSPLSN